MRRGDQMNQKRRIVKGKVALVLVKETSVLTFPRCIVIFSLSPVIFFGFTTGEQTKQKKREEAALDKTVSAALEARDCRGRLCAASSIVEVGCNSSSFVTSVERFR